MTAFYVGLAVGFILLTAAVVITLLLPTKGGRP